MSEILKALVQAKVLIKTVYEEFLREEEAVLGALEKTKKDARITCAALNREVEEARERHGRKMAFFKTKELEALAKVEEAEKNFKPLQPNP